jgi:hypothetical protein
VASFSFQSPLFPDGAVVGVYNAQGYDAFPSWGPPGSAVTTATVEHYGLSFSGLEDEKPYFAALEVDGVWRSIRFSTDAPASSSGNLYVNVYGSDASTARKEGFVNLWVGDKEAEVPEHAKEGDLILRETE